MSQPFKLYRLQQIDSQLDKVQARLREIEIALSENETLRQAQQALDQAAERLETERKNLRRAEDSVRDQRIKIEQTESTLYSGKVRSPKELQDMQNEIAALKRYRSVLEDRQIEVMITTEDAEAVHQAAAAELEKVRTALAQQFSDLAVEQTNLRRDAARIEGERQATANSIAEEDLKLYNQLRKQRRGIAVAKVTDRACAACGTTLSATLLNAARLDGQITRCETCGRILYGL